MITVTGANGLAGCYIVKEFLNRGEQVRVVVREGSDCTELESVKEKVEWKYADVNNYDALVDALKGSDVVIHTAAVVSYHSSDKDLMRQVNVIGTRHVVNVCLQEKVPTLLHISSVAVLGKLETSTLIDETATWIDDDTVSDYALTKHHSELEVWRGGEEGLNIIIVNPSVILAPTDFNKSSAQLFGYVWKEKKFYTEGAINTIDVRDLATCCYLLLQEKHFGERFILSHEAISYEVFFKSIANKWNKKPPSIKVSKKWMLLLAKLEAIRSWLTKSKPLITVQTARLAGRKVVYKNDKIKKALNFEFQSIENSIDWCCAEYMKKFENKK